MPCPPDYTVEICVALNKADTHDADAAGHAAIQRIRSERDEDVAAVTFHTGTGARPMVAHPFATIELSITADSTAMAFEYAKDDLRDPQLGPWNVEVYLRKGEQPAYVSVDPREKPDRPMSLMG